MAKVIVTGAQGFIGHHLVERLLERGDEVTCFTRRASPWDERRGSQLHVARGSLEDLGSLQKAFAGVDVVYHLAGLNRARRFAELLHVNGLGTRNVARVCEAQRQPPILVSVSSLAAAGPSTNHRAARETDPARPVSHYGRSKRAGELAVAAHAHRVPITIVRPPIVFGPYDRVSFEMFRAIRHTRLHLSAGYQRGQFSIIHASDLADGLILVAESGKRIDPNSERSGQFHTGCYFLANRQRPNFVNLGRYIADAVDCRVWPFVMPAALAWTTSAVCEVVGQLRGKPLVLNLDKIREATAGGWTCSTERAERELGFTPPENLQQRLHETAQWYRQAGWLK